MSLRNSSRHRRGALGAVLLLTLLGAAAGTRAAQPEPGAQYSACFGSQCQVVFTVTRDGRYVRGFYAAVRCGPSPVLSGMRIDRRGAFGLHGRRGKVTVTVRGRFRARAYARGTVRFQRTGCDSGAVRFAAALE